MNGTNSAYQKLTEDVFHLNLRRGKWWGAGLMGYWAVLVLISSLENFGSRLYPNATLAFKKALSQRAPVRWFRRHVSMPAFMNGKHTRASRLLGVLPTRFESIILFGYFVLVVIGESVNYEVIQHNTYWPHKRDQISRYVGDRSAIIAMFIIIPTYLFAGRNNILLWLTGWKQSTFYTFHKWLARMAIASSLVHTLAMLLNVYWCHTIHRRKYTQYWRWGSVAIVAGAIMLFQSISFIRSHWYEFFLYGHIILALFFLIGVWIHLHELGYAEYAYATAAIWVFDRVVRILRIGSFGVRFAHVTMVDEETILMTIRDLPTIKKPTPGSFGYVYFLSDWFFFQSHPFCILQRDDSSIVFSIKVKNGATRRLSRYLLNNPNSTQVIKVALEGFYGEYKPVYAYEQVIMVSSGSGVLGPLEYVQDIQNKILVKRSRTKHIKFYCIVRHWEGIRWLFPELLRLSDLEYVHPVIYITQPETGKLEQTTFEVEEKNASSKSSTSSGRAEIEQLILKNAESKQMEIEENTLAGTAHEILFKELPRVEFRWVRPNVSQLIIKDIEEAASSDSIAVMTCAHGSISDEIRNTTAIKAFDNRSGRLDLIELLQTW
ncbi:uncharacterized protein ZBAI_03033 [Zygosaccharomyces bailii ISA1307]|nr:uncharacterized protein ZBAI_03033 [Zygosaccharomyces bailii ISA1307]